MRNRKALDIWEVSSLHRGIDRLFEDMLVPIEGMVKRESFAPSCDVEESDTHFLMSFDLPGVSKDDVKIEIQDNQLIVSGERKEEKRDEKNKRITERFYGSFQRVFTLPSHVDSAQVEANFENGVLYLAVPKIKSVQPQQIQIGNKKSGIFGRLTQDKAQEQKKAG